ncbi:hypothetical protein IQ07DRAFT_637274 [Pyrenochaeta sp. DS3sAY3a]|nr:hypothetical protein IQ07DRAFT_637274 [Pyrenochaeta sp. DS3sAY3a]
MGENTTRAPEHPEHVWEAHRHLFTKLYKVEKRKLAEVKRIMQDEHGFHATERQYKRKIKKWDLEKNSKATEKQHALMTLKSSDSSLDMACSYKLNGKIIPAHKLLRFARSGRVGTPLVARDSIKRASRSSQFRFRDIGPTIALEPNQRCRNKTAKFHDLAELLASATCFMWFEKWDSLKSVSHDRSALSFPSAGFLKWTRTILSTTQLSMNNVVLAALYIYRLKRTNPTVIGKPGSEYRLATIALMLSNKYLNDDTYTNKTWADVTGISVQEVHIMEVEFLSNMRYSLMVHSHSWKAWVEQLEELQEFFRQSPIETARTIELPDLPQGNHPMVPSKGPDIEMHDILDAESSLEAGGDMRGAPVYVIPDSPSLEMNDISAPEIPMSYVNACSNGKQRESHFNLQALPSSDEESLQYMPTSLSESVQSIQTDNISQDADDMIDLMIENGTIELVDRSFADMTFPSPPIPSILTLELPPPEPNPEDIFLEWKSIDSSELQEGPIPDLDSFLDSSLWEVDSEPLQLDWDPVLFLEQPGGTGSPPSD